jgi:hypothetical protein
MPKSNVVAIRDERGRYLKGMRGGPGRPLGSRNKLREDFFADMHDAWLEHGPDVIDRLIAERPEIFLMAMLKIAQVHDGVENGDDALDDPDGNAETIAAGSGHAASLSSKMQVAAWALATLSARRHE